VSTLHYVLQKRVNVVKQGTTAKTAAPCFQHYHTAAASRGVKGDQGSWGGIENYIIII
jgi:hypothetical protein